MARRLADGFQNVLGISQNGRHRRRHDGRGIKRKAASAAAAALKSASLSTSVRKKGKKKRKKGATGAAVSSYLIPSCESHGAISTINALAVINTVSRQPMARKRSGGGERGAGRGGGAVFVSLAILSPSSFSCHFVPVITPKMVAGLCDLLRWRGGQTGTGGVGGEEDYGMEEGASYFPFCWWRARWPRHRGRNGGEVEVFERLMPLARRRGRFNSTAAGCCGVSMSDKVFVLCQRKKTKKNKHPLMVCLCCFFFSSNIVIYMCLIYAAHV